MSVMRGVLVGTLALSAFEAVVTSNRAISNTSGLVGIATSAITRLTDPTVPLIPDLRDSVHAAPTGKAGPSLGPGSRTVQVN